jgi:hypothetical protein
VALGGLVVGAAAAFGTEDATLPLWLVVLFGLVELGTVIALVVLYRGPRRSRAAPAPPTAPPPHPHAKLLGRITALSASIGDLDPQDAVDGRTADIFNRILTDARRETDDPALGTIERYRVPPGEPYARSGDLGELRMQLRQIETIVDHSPE